VRRLAVDPAEFARQVPVENICRHGKESALVLRIYNNRCHIMEETKNAASVPSAKPPCRPLRRL
jgi:hypothetical protein